MLAQIPSAPLVSESKGKRERIRSHYVKYEGEHLQVILQREVIGATPS